MDATRKDLLILSVALLVLGIFLKGVLQVWTPIPWSIMEYRIKDLDGLGFVCLLLSLYGLFKLIRTYSSSQDPGHPNVWKIAVALIVSFFVFLSVTVLAYSWTTGQVWAGSGQAFIEHYGEILEATLDAIRRLTSGG